MDLTIRAADDFHLHLRNDDRTPTAVAAVRAGGVARALVMPNTLPPICEALEAERYRGALKSQGANFTILSTIKLTGKTTPEQVVVAAKQGVLAGKLYPQGVTTHSEDGVRDFFELYEVFEAMPDAFVADALSSGGKFTGNYLAGGLIPHSLSFKFFAADVLPSSLLLRFYGMTGGGQQSFFTSLTSQLASTGS